MLGAATSQASSQLSRSEHLAWAKARALTYVEGGELLTAVCQMTVDLLRHPAWDDHEFVRLMACDAILYRIPRGAEHIRAWVEDWR